MKTPRDLLLARHHPATPQLDAMRAQALAAAFPNTRAPRPATARIRDWWQELFWPARRAWLGLAAVWVVILGSQLARTERGTPSISPACLPPSCSNCCGNNSASAPNCLMTSLRPGPFRGRRTSSTRAAARFRGRSQLLETPRRFDS